MNVAAVLIVAAMVVSEYNPDAAKLQNNREAFKQKMTPHLGKVVTVTGELCAGKQSDFIRTDDPGAVFVKPVSSEDTKKRSELSRLLGKRLSVTGVLHFQKSSPPQPPGQPVVGLVDEHFFIDLSKATIEAVGAER